MVLNSIQNICFLFRVLLNLTYFTVPLSHNNFKHKKLMSKGDLILMVKSEIFFSSQSLRMFVKRSFRVVKFIYYACIGGQLCCSLTAIIGYSDNLRQLIMGLIKTTRFFPMSKKFLLCSISIN